jgi:hypothetical protein
MAEITHRTAQPNIVYCIFKKYESSSSALGSVEGLRGRVTTKGGGDRLCQNAR